MGVRAPRPGPRVRPRSRGASATCRRLGRGRPVLARGRRVRRRRATAGAAPRAARGPGRRDHRLARLRRPAEGPRVAAPPTSGSRSCRARSRSAASRGSSPASGSSSSLCSRLRCSWRSTARTPSRTSSDRRPVDRASRSRCLPRRRGARPDHRGAAVPGCAPPVAPAQAEPRSWRCSSRRSSSGWCTSSATRRSARSSRSRRSCCSAWCRGYQAVRTGDLSRSIMLHMGFNTLTSCSSSPDQLASLTFTAHVGPQAAGRAAGNRLGRSRSMLGGSRALSTCSKPVWSRSACAWRARAHVPSVRSLRSADVGDGRRADPARARPRPGPRLSDSLDDFGRDRRSRLAAAGGWHAGPVVATQDVSRRARATRRRVAVATDRSWYERGRDCGRASPSSALCCALRPRAAPAAAARPQHHRRRRRHRRARRGSPRSSATTCCRGGVAGWSPDFYAGFPAGQFYFPLPALLIVASTSCSRTTSRSSSSPRSGRCCSPSSAVRVRPGDPRAAPGARAVRGRRHRLPVLQGRRRRDDELRPPHHGRHAHEHARRRVLVHDRGSRARCASSARCACTRPRSGRRATVGSRRCSSRRPPRATSWSASSRLYGALVIWLLRRPLRARSHGRGDRRGRRAAHRGVVAPARGHARVHDRHALRADRPALPRLDVPLGDVVPVPARGSSPIVGGDRLPATADARPRRDRGRGGTGVLRLGAAARRLRQGPGVEPAAPAVLVPLLYLLAGARRRRDRRWWAAARVAGWARVRDVLGRRPEPSRGRRRRRHRTTWSPSTTRQPVARLDVAVAASLAHRGRLARALHDGRAGARRTTTAWLPAVLGAVQLHRVRGRQRPATSPSKSYAEYRGVHRHRGRAAAGPHVVGGQLGDRRLRHAARADAAAVLDRRAHRVDGGPLLRGRGDAPPYHFMAAATLTAGSRRTRCAASVPHVRRLRPRRAVPPAPRRALLRGDDRGGEGSGRRRIPRSARSPPSPTSTGARRRVGRSTRSRDAALVAPLRYEPVVVDDIHARSRTGSARGAPSRRPERRESPSSTRGSASSVPWFDDPDALDRPLTDDGPAAGSARPWRRRAKPTKRALPQVDGDEHRAPRRDSIEFDVSRTGVPVLVKTSYYPNWEVEGADGPWRATPNLMVVVPTEQARDAHVRHDRGGVARALRSRSPGIVGLGLLLVGRSGPRRCRLRPERQARDSVPGGKRPRRGTIARPAPRTER